MTDVLPMFSTMLQLGTNHTLVCATAGLIRNKTVSKEVTSINGKFKVPINLHIGNIGLAQVGVAEAVRAHAPFAYAFKLIAVLSCDSGTSGAMLLQDIAMSQSAHMTSQRSACQQRSCWYV
jgi:hypothetical protein